MAAGLALDGDVVGCSEDLLGGERVFRRDLAVGLGDGVDYLGNVENHFRAIAFDDFHGPFLSVCSAYRVSFRLIVTN